jgi:para-nitrobenzyl esterase
VIALADDLLVKLSDGSQVQGFYNPSGNREWDGIPYAKPPVGDLRWEFPEAPDAWSDVRQPYNAPGCPQTCNLPYGSCSDFGYDEDCLYLNVWSPKEPSSDPAGYPVMMWIHGGAFSQGLGDSAIYNGTQFTENGVIVVTINYRLGALGYMASESMQGNYGIMDQIQALKWIQSNIEYFGGNKDRVTIDGQSAGGESTTTLLTSPDAVGLFHQTIIQSNPLALPSHTRESAAKNAKDVFEYCGCTKDDVACMKKVPADKVVEAQHEAPRVDMKNLFINFQTFSPMVDSKQGPVPQQPLYALQEGAFPPMPIMAGSVSEEGWLFVYELFVDPLKKKEYYGLLDVLFGLSTAKTVKKMYPYDLLSDNEDDGRNVLSVLGTDLLMLCPLRNATRGFMAAQKSAAKPMFRYEHRQVIQEDVWEPSNPYCFTPTKHDCHASELPFMWNVWTDNHEHTYEPTSDEKQLVQDMSRAWANFITSGDPNVGMELPAKWPVYDAVSDPMAVLVEPGYGTDSQFRTIQCDMWDNLGYFW